MIFIEDKTKCCGCTACKNVCPKQCIEMIPDFEGFLYPKVNAKECVECNKCVRVCPVLNHEVKQKKYQEAYALRTKSDRDLRMSTSGGFTTPLAFWVFEQGGKLWTTTYDDNWKVCHAEFDSANTEFAKTRGSKYVQSDLGDSFTKIQKDLENGKLICFIGTTCQVYGLKSYLGTTYDNLITVDLVCHGTPSPKLWNKYVSYQEKCYGSRIKEVNFRNKTYGYHSGTMMLQFENGKKYTGSARVDFMLKSFFSEIASRPSCYDCVFKEKYRNSDFTIFDCWHMSELVFDQRDDDRGYTNVLIQSEKGRQIFEHIRNQYNAYEIDVDKAITLDGIMVNHSAIPHPARNEFYKDIEKNDLKTHIRRYVGIKKIDYIIEMSKMIFYKLGLMSVLRKMRR